MYSRGVNPFRAFAFRGIWRRGLGLLASLSKVCPRVGARASPEGCAEGGSGDILSLVRLALGAF